jgi:hypothetical protein
MAVVLQNYWVVGPFFASKLHKYSGYAANMLEKLLDKERFTMI